MWVYHSHDYCRHAGLSEIKKPIKPHSAGMIGGEYVPVFRWTKPVRATFDYDKIIHKIHASISHEK